MTEWVAFIDIDEYISAPGNATNIKSVLVGHVVWGEGGKVGMAVNTASKSIQQRSAHPLPGATSRLAGQFLMALPNETSSLAIGWTLFGSSGHDRRPAGLVVENYVLVGNKLREREFLVLARHPGCCVKPQGLPSIRCCYFFNRVSRAHSDCQFSLVESHIEVKRIVRPARVLRMATHIADIAWGRDVSVTGTDLKRCVQAERGGGDAASVSRNTMFSASQNIQHSARPPCQSEIVNDTSLKSHHINCNAPSTPFIYGGQTTT